MRCSTAHVHNCLPFLNIMHLTENFQFFSKIPYFLLNTGILNEASIKRFYPATLTFNGLKTNNVSIISYLTCVLAQETYSACLLKVASD